MTDREVTEKLKARVDQWQVYVDQTLPGATQRTPPSMRLSSSQAGDGHPEARAILSYALRGIENADTPRPAEAPPAPSCPAVIDVEPYSDLRYYNTSRQHRTLEYARRSNLILSFSILLLLAAFCSLFALLLDLRLF